MTQTALALHIYETQQHCRLKHLHMIPLRYNSICPQRNDSNQKYGPDATLPRMQNATGYIGVAIPSNAGQAAGAYNMGCNIA